MIDYELAERVFENINQRLIIPAFRKLALTYSVPNTLVYDILEDYFYDPEDSESDRKDLVDKVRVRLVRLINELRSDESNDKADIAFYVSKIYDEKLHENMVASYRNLAKTIGDNITLMFSPETLLRNISLEKRAGFAFVESALLLCLFLSIKGKSIGMLMEKMDTTNKVKRAKLRLRKIKDTLFSKDFENLLMGLMMDFIAAHHQKIYADNLNRHLRSFWLSPSKRHLKTAKYAVERYGGELVSNDYYPEKEYEKLSDWDKIRLFEENQELMNIQRLLYIIFPITEAFIIDALPNSVEEALAKAEKEECMAEGEKRISIRKYLLESKKISIETKEYIKNMPSAYYMVSCEDYLVAQKFCSVLKNYCGEVQKAVVALLEILPGTQVTGEQSLREYMFNL